MHKVTSINTNASTTLKTRLAIVRCFFVYNETDRLLKIASTAFEIFSKCGSNPKHCIRMDFFHMWGPV